MKAPAPTPLPLCTAIIAGCLITAPLAATAQTQTYPGPAYQRPNPYGQGSYQNLANQVAQISANDQRQDIRLYQLERDVDKVTSAPPPSPETGASSTPQLMPYKSYQVRKGDSLWRIAMNHRISPGDLMSFNRMPNDTVVEGQVLMIPQKSSGTASPQAAPSTAPAGFHTVKPNETFHSIGKQYGVSAAAIAKANPKLDPAKLQLGAKVAIPGNAKVAPPSPAPKPPAGNVAAAKPPAPTPSQKSNGSYTVQAGDTLSGIAQKHHISTAALSKANGITNANSLQIGQKLVIPGGASAAPTAVAGKSATGGKPAPKSPVAPKPPAPGTGLAAAPAYPQAPEKPVPPAPPPPPPGNRGVVAYRMDKGDTVDSVAQMFGTSGTEIRRLNKLPVTAKLNEGDEILVPAMGPIAGN